MKKYLILMLMLPLLSGCTSVKLGKYELTDLHYVKSDTPSVYKVTFMDTASAWPVYRWRLKIENKGDTYQYKLRLYSSLLQKKPDKTIFTDYKTGYTTITLCMPEFRSNIDQLVLVDAEGLHVVELKENQQANQGIDLTR